MHKAAGARFGGFAGWSMPLTYPPGVMKEHLHTREHAGLFDISHMKLFDVSGPGAAALLDRACPLQAEALELSQSKYTFLLTDKAGIIDDLIVTRLEPQRFMVVANAGNAAADEAHLRKLAGDFEVTVTPLDRVFLALQGPAAADALLRIGIETDALTFMHGIELRHDWFLSRSGYTGEDGFEIGLPEADARALVAELFADPARHVDRARRPRQPAARSRALPARPGHHHRHRPRLRRADVGDPQGNPRQWRLSSAPSRCARFWRKGPAEKRVGLKPEGRQPVRAGTALTDADGKPAGRVTSGGFGPSAGSPVAMGYVSAPLAKPGTRLFADVRGTKIPLDVHPLPFTPHRYRKG